MTNPRAHAVTETSACGSQTPRDREENPRGQGTAEDAALPWRYRYDSADSKDQSPCGGERNRAPGAGSGFQICGVKTGAVTESRDTKIQGRGNVEGHGSRRTYGRPLVKWGLGHQHGNL